MLTSPPSPTPSHTHPPPTRLPQVIAAELDYKLACSGYDVRGFVVAALESMGSGGGLEGAKAELLAALDAAEAAAGGELSGDSDKGWPVLAAKLGDIERKYGLADKAKVREEAIFEMYKAHIGQLRSQVGAGGGSGRGLCEGRSCHVCVWRCVCACACVCCVVPLIPSTCTHTRAAAPPPLCHTLAARRWSTTWTRRGPATTSPTSRPTWRPSSPRSSDGIR